MAAASNVIPFGLLYMRPLQWWLKTKGFSPRGNPLRMIRVSRRCVRALDMWRKPWFLNLGPVLGAPCRQLSLATDASLTGWGAVMSGRSARGLWSGRHLIWHIYCLEMLAVFRVFLPDLRGHHVLVRTNNTAVVSYIIHQGGLRSRPLYKLAHQILLWSQDKFLLLRALFIPGYLNVGPDVLSRQGPRPGVWMLHPEVVKQIWRMFYQLEVDLFAIECAMSPLVLSNSSSSPRTGRYSTDMAEAASVRLSPDRSAPRSSDESTPRRCSPTVSSPVLAGPSMVLGPDFPPRRISFGGSHQEGSPLTSRGCHSAPPPGVMENVGVAPEGAQLIASGLPAEVVETILQSRAPSTRKVYALKWKFFTSWCRARQQDPVNCPVVQFLSICRLDSLQGYPTPQWRCMWRHYRLTTHRSMETQWANTPWWYASSAVRWGWGRQCVLASPRGTWRWW